MPPQTLGFLSYPSQGMGSGDRGLMSVVIFVCPVLAGGGEEMHTGLFELLRHLNVSRETLVDLCINTWLPPYCLGSTHFIRSLLPEEAVSLPDIRGLPKPVPSNPDSRFSSLSHRR